MLGIYNPKQLQMHPAEISEDVGQVSREQQAEASFPLELDQLDLWVQELRDYVNVGYCYIFSTYGPAPFGRICGMAFGLGRFFIGRFTFSRYF